MRGRLLGDFPMLHLSTFPPKTWAVLVTALFFWATQSSVVKKSLAFGSVYFYPVLVRPNRPLRRLGGPI